MSQYATWPISGGSGSGVTSLNSLVGGLSIAAGANITVTPSGSTITIASSGTPSLALTDGHIFVGDNTNSAADVAMSGDISIDDTGATTVQKIQTKTVSGTTGTGNVVFSASPTLTGTLTAATVTASGAVTGSNLSGSNTGDQTITLTGDVTGSGTGSFAATVANSAITNAKMANMAQSTIKGRAASAGTGAPVDLTATQATAILNNMVGDSGSGGTAGLVPAPGAGDAAAGKFLKADGTFAVPSGGGGGSGTVTSVSVVSANGMAGSVATATTTPAITLSTSITGILQGNGTAISAASTTGSGSVVLATSPSLTTPTIGVATATTVNKVTITAPATSSTLTLVDGSTLATSGAFSTTLTATASTNVTLPTAGTLSTLAGTETLTNKRITRRVVTAADATSVTPNSDNADCTYQLNTQSTGTLTMNADAGTPTNSQAWLFKIKSTNVQTFSWNAVFAAGTVALPTASSGSGKIDYYSFIYDTVNSKWHFTGNALGF